MARNNGPIQFIGSLGNIRSYYDPTLKKYILSTKGGANKNLIMNNPSFARTRDCMNEFSACSKWVSMIRKSLFCLNHLTYKRYFSGVVKLAKVIQLQDEVSTFGFRNILSSKCPNLLKEINFNQEHPFAGVIHDAYNVTFSADKKTVQLSMPGFIPATKLWWSTPFFSYRFYLVIAQLSDMVWYEKEKRYIPVVDDLRGLTKSQTTNWMINNMEPVDILMEVSFDQPALSQPGTTVLVALGIEMSAGNTSGSAYITPGNGTVGIVECYS